MSAIEEGPQRSLESLMLGPSAPFQTFLDYRKNSSEFIKDNKYAVSKTEFDEALAFLDAWEHVKAEFAAPTNDEQIDLPSYVPTKFDDHASNIAEIDSLFLGNDPWVQNIQDRIAFQQERQDHLSARARILQEWFVYEL